MKRLSLLLVMIFVLGMVFTALNASEVTIGAGDQQARMPVDMYWKNSLQEILYYQTELNIVSGSITGVAFYNNFVTDLPAKPVKIWLGTTTANDLSAGWIPSTALTQVFDGVVNFPMGANTINITFATPFNYTGGTLVMMVNRPMDTEYFSSSDNFACQTIGTNRSLKLQSDSTTYDPAAPATGATLSGQFPKTTFFYTGQGITNDLGILSLSGNTTPSAQSAWNYTIAVKNNGQATQTAYTVKLFKEGDVEIGSVAGTSITEAQTLEYTIPWTPTTVGPTYLYAKVILTGDQVPANNQSANYPVVVQAAGVVAITVGTGGSTARVPVDMYYKNSLFESVYLATELNIGGLLTGIQFYNNFTTNLPSMPTKIWVGETTQTDLSAGWIPSTQLTSVFDGVVNYPSGANNINITFTTPFPYGGGNLVVMVQRPMDAEYYASTDAFVSQTIGTNRALNLYSDTVAYDPAAPATATASGVFPKTTFFFITQGMGALNGTVTVGGTPLAGATVTVANSTLTYTTGANGTYSFPYIAQGAQAVSATKHGYNVVTNNVTITENQTTTSNFALALLPQVTVTGKIVGSDAPTVGLAGATIALSGYEPYTATTNATGDFTLTGVFASQTYNYTANATGYAAATGTVVVGTSNVNMGNITVSEMSYPPYGVVAAEAANFSNVAVTWQAPNPGAVGITEGFEGTAFPPTDWTQVITDTGAAGTTGVFPTWCRIGTVALTPPVPAHGGEYQAAMWWSYAHQDEWLNTPQFTCPGSASLNFWSYVFYGSVNNDHYYVKVSTDNGANWTILWDATTLTGGQNAYTTPIAIDLSAYAGQQIKLAFHADDPNTTNDGMWYVWFLDDISIAGPSGLLKFNADQLVSSSQAEVKAPVSFPGLPSSRALVANPKLSEPTLTVADGDSDRTMLGYKVWRLLAANQANEALWTPLTATTITPTNYTDNAWQPLPSGVYKYAVKSVYTNNVMSTPAFSNEIHKGMMGTLTGTVTEFGTNLPVAGATVTAGEYSGVTNATGVYSFGVYAGTYTVTCAKPSYQTATQAGVVVTGMQTTTQNFVMTEITLPAAAVVAALAGSNVNVTWMAPGTGGGEWIHYDSGENDDSIGTGGAANFDVAVRYPGSALTDYVGMSLYALKLWPAQAATFSARVWTGGTATAPGTMVADQAFTPELDVYNTVMLTNPVAITGSEELWFGYNVNAATGYPAGCDAGPALDGFGNMMYYQDAWTTLLALAPSLNYNWNIQGYVGYSAPTAAPELTTINGTLFAKTAHPVEFNGDRALTGYKVWRLMQGQETNENAWTSLTPNPITATAYQDTGWGPLPDGIYKWAVKAVYTGGAYAIPAFSNNIPKTTQIGTIAGIVRNQQNQAISGATVTCGTVTATTNASGAYSMTVGAGTHSVTASHASYSPVTQTGVIVVTGQTTTVNFQLPASANLLVDGFETYTNFAIDFAPWTLVDVDMSATYGMTGTAWENAYAPMAYIIFNPSATVPPVADLATHGGDKMACSFASTTPANNDWMITPQYTGVTQFRFWAKSYTAQYGLERFKVGVSTTGTAPANFTIVSGATHVEAPVEWTEFVYDLPTYSSTPIRIGIQCLSNDAFVFCVDDVVIRGASANEDPIVPVIATELKNNFPNPFNPQTTISYSVKEASPVSIEIYNVKGQLVKTLENSVKEAGNHNIVWNGKDSNGRAVSSGVYYYKMNAGTYSSTKKMIMMK